MNSHFELHTWRMATSYCGQSFAEEVYEEYAFQDSQVSAKVYRIPDEWIEKISLPAGFFEQNTDAVGCVKTSYFNEDNQPVPCVLFDMEKQRSTWDGYENEMDPVLYLIQEYIKYEVLQHELVIIQSATNPWYVGVIFHCNISQVKPLPWSSEDRTMIYGIDEVKTDS